MPRCRDRPRSRGGPRGRGASAERREQQQSEGAPSQSVRAPGGEERPVGAVVEDDERAHQEGGRRHARAREPPAPTHRVEATSPPTGPRRAAPRSRCRASALRVSGRAYGASCSRHSRAWSRPSTPGRPIAGVGVCAHRAGPPNRVAGGVPGAPRLRALGSLVAGNAHWRRRENTRGKRGPRARLSPRIRNRANLRARLEDGLGETRSPSKLFDIATVQDQRVQAHREAALRLRCALAGDAVAER